MPSLQDWVERVGALESTLDLQAREITELKDELTEAIAGNARVIKALDAALQWGEALFAFLPEGTILPEGVKTAHGALREALGDIRR